MSMNEIYAVQRMSKKGIFVAYMGLGKFCKTKKEAIIFFEKYKKQLEKAIREVNKIK